MRQRDPFDEPTLDPAVLRPGQAGGIGDRRAAQVSVKACGSKFAQQRVEQVMASRCTDVDGSLAAAHGQMMLGRPYLAVSVDLPADRPAFRGEPDRRSVGEILTAAGGR